MGVGDIVWFQGFDNEFYGIVEGVEGELYKIRTTNFSVSINASQMDLTLVAKGGEFRSMEEAREYCKIVRKLCKKVT